jgi:hypothetical protein
MRPAAMITTAQCRAMHSRAARSDRSASDDASARVSVAGFSKSVVCGGQTGRVGFGIVETERAVPMGSRAQSVIVVPTVLITNASGNRVANWCTARHPVQWAGTTSDGESSASASAVGLMMGSNIGPLR